MREIKFRAWDVAESEMVYGMNKCLMNWDGVQHNVARLFNGDIPIMQYTGLRDKNGNEIYEGDVITDVEFVGEVVFHDRWYEVGMHSGKLAWCIFDKKKGDYIEIGSCNDEETWEIIGNIYENPESLEEKRNEIEK